MDSAAGEAHNVSKLETLSLAIFSHILGFKGMTQPTIRLFLSGAPTLRKKICSSAWKMSLKSHLRRDFSLLPTMLGSLTNLRELTIVCYRSRLLSVIHTLSVLRSVGSRLEKLIFRWNGSAHFCEPPPHIVEENPYKSIGPRYHNDFDQPIGDYLNLGDHFPRLQTLELASEDDPHCSTLQWLPTSLTHLTCRLKVPASAKNVMFLPRMTHLTVFSSAFLSQAFWDDLPHGLECLDLSSTRIGKELTLKQAKALPRTLKKLVMPHGSTHYPMAVATINALPPKLEAIENVHHSILDNLPFKLTHLAISTGHASLDPARLRQLPRSMTLLRSSLANEHELNVGDFPPSLTLLGIALSGEFPCDNFGALLPAKTLHTLEISHHKMNVAFINQLPPNLTHLSIDTSNFIVKETDVLQLPPLLTSFTLIGMQNDDTALRIAKMPSSLTQANLDVLLHVSALFMLPPLLRRLSLSKVQGLLSFDPRDTATVERITFLRKEALAAGFILDETLPTRKPRPYGVFDLLPRALKHLVIACCDPEGALNVEAWQSIPKNLRRLEIDESDHGLPSDFLDYLPYELVTIGLRLPEVTLRDGHIKRLNPLLRFFQTSSDSNDALTLSCVPFIPRNISAALLHNPSIASEFRRLNERRAACLEQSDRKTFRSLGFLQKYD